MDIKRHVYLLTYFRDKKKALENVIGVAERTTIQGTADSRVTSAEIVEKRDIYKPCAGAEVLHNTWRWRKRNGREKKETRRKKKIIHMLRNWKHQRGIFHNRNKGQRGLAPWTATVEVDNVHLEMEIDTGSTKSIMGKRHLLQVLFRKTAEHKGSSLHHILQKGVADERNNRGDSETQPAETPA